MTGGQQPYATVSSVPIATPAGPMLPMSTDEGDSRDGCPATECDPVGPMTTTNAAANANGLNNNTPSSVAPSNATTNVNNSSPSRSSSADKDSGVVTAASATSNAVAHSVGVVGKDETDDRAGTDSSTIPDAKKPIPPIAKSPPPTATVPPAMAPPAATPPTVTKKDRLGAFLPNGCTYMFPFIKSKKDKKDKEKKNGTKEQQSALPEMEPAKTTAVSATPVPPEETSSDEHLNANM